MISSVRVARGADRGGAWGTVRPLRRKDRPELVVDDDVQERRVDLQSAVVLDEAELAKFVHEIVDPRPRRTHPRRQYLLIDLGNDGFQLAVLAEVGEQQENASQPFFA